MGKNSKKQRDQKRYYQELEARKEEDRLRKEEAKRSRSVASTRGVEPAQGGTEADVMSALKHLGDWEEMDQSERGQNRGVHHFQVEEVNWQEGVEPKTLSFPADLVARSAKASDGDEKWNLSNFESDLATKFSMFIEAVYGEHPSQESKGFMFYMNCWRYTVDELSQERDYLLPLVREANEQLRSRRLPLPRGTDLKIPFDLLPGKIVPELEQPQPKSPTKHLDSERQVEKSVQELRSENSELKSNLSALKAEVKEAYQARDSKEEENDELVKQISEAKVEQKEKVEKLREKNTKLKSTTPTSSPTSSSSSKSIFVVQALSKQVKDLSRELKEKNDQLAELITELTKSG